MTTVDTEHKSPQNTSAPQIEKTGGSEKYVLGALLFGFVALLLYQSFFCPTCYG